MNPQFEIIIEARHFLKGNLNRSHHGFGHGLVIDGGYDVGFAEYEIDIPKTAYYELRTAYLSPELRPVDIFLNDRCLKKWAMSQSTKSMEYLDIGDFSEGCYVLKEGQYLLKILCRGVIPHIEKLRFIEVSDNLEIAKSTECNECDDTEAGINKTALLNQASKQKTLLVRSRDNFKRLGWLKTLKKTGYYFSSNNLKEKYARILGVLNGNLAFLGPKLVQIDLTYNCNNNCIGCWCHADLLAEKKMPEIVKQSTLPFEMVIELIDELYSLGTRELYFAGGGEPFMHPRLMDIIEHAKGKDMVCFINTNFTLVSEKDIKRIIQLGVDHLTVSIWAGTPETYIATHPNKDEQTFFSLKEKLLLLNTHKTAAPRVKIYNVISNKNYFEIEQMVQFAVETKSDAIEFTMIDTIPDKTDVLLLNKEQNVELIAQCKKLQTKIETTSLGSKIILFGFAQFLKRISNAGSLSGDHDKGIVDKIPCYIGWLFSRINADGDVNACLKAHRIPVGNIYQDCFTKIWNGKKQIEFRNKTKAASYEDEFFSKIGNDPNKAVGCYKSCDDIARNIQMKEKIESLHSLELFVLRCVVFLRNLSQSLSMKKSRISSHYLSAKDMFKRADDYVRGDKKKKEFILSNLAMVGILTGREAFAGPEHVVIDITNKCDLRCIGCWTRSPLLQDKVPPLSWHQQELSLTKIKQLVDDLVIMGTKRIRFTGGGEPFLHPHIDELIEYVKAKGLICAITTNGASLSKQRIKKLVDFGLDELAVSLWAGSAQGYVVTHPGKVAADFTKIKDNLIYLKELKNGSNLLPKLTLCNVISNLNYQDADCMMDLAYEAGANAAYFTLVDVIAGATDNLLLTDSMQKRLLATMQEIQKKNDLLPEDKKIFLDNFDGFVRRLQNDKDSIVGEYDRNMVSQIPCYVGWLFVRIMANGDVSPCCRGVNAPLGNISEASFLDIWNSNVYQEFRSKAKFLKKNDDYFSLFGCYRTCDNLMHNEPVHNKLKSFSCSEIKTLKEFSNY